MCPIIDRKYATAILYEYLSHASDLIQARGMKRLFEYYALKNNTEAICLMRRMANRRWKSAFPNLDIAKKLLMNAQIEKFASIIPNNVSNDTYSLTIKGLIELALAHEKETIKLLNEESKKCSLEDFDIIEDFSCEADCLCKYLMRMITKYNKYNWKSEYLENDQILVHDHFEEKTKEGFKIDFC